MADTATLVEKRYSRLASLGAFLAIIGTGVLFVGAIGYRAGLGEFPFVPDMLRWGYGFAIGTLTQYGAYAALVGGVLGLMGFGATLPGGGKRGFVGAVIAIVLGFGSAGQIGQAYWNIMTNPFIHDISTDLDTPPAFVDVIAARQAFAAASLDELNALDYTPAVAAQQRGAQLRPGYHDLSPVHTAEAPATVFEKALALVESEGWKVVASVAEEGRIEATATTRFYKFRDDIVLRVRADGTGTRVDMRSASRVGHSDVGVNAARVEEFMNRLRVATGS